MAWNPVQYRLECRILCNKSQDGMCCALTAIPSLGSTNSGRCSCTSTLAHPEAHSRSRVQTMPVLIASRSSQWVYSDTLTLFHVPTNAYETY